MSDDHSPPNLQYVLQFAEENATRKKSYLFPYNKYVLLQRLLQLVVL